MTLRSTRPLVPFPPFLDRCLLVAIVLVLAGSSRLDAQSGPSLLDQVRRVDQERRQDLAYTQWLEKPPPRSHYEFGAWTAPSYLTLDDFDTNSSAPDSLESLLLIDQRIWFRWDMPKGEQVYLRGRYFQLLPSTAPGASKPTLFEEGWNLDLGYMDLPLGDSKLRLGRQLISLEKGLVLSSNLDGFEVTYRKSNWTTRGFWGKTPDATSDLDSVVGRSDRVFAGLHAQMVTEEDKRHFVYFLDQNDRTGTVLSGQGLRYDSRYLAFGSEGGLVKDFTYYLEGILQSGSSFDFGSATSRSDIEAYAVQLEATWRPEVYHHPTLSAGFFRGSGDVDRVSVVTSAAGNIGGTPDEAFIGQGQFEGGLALTPRLSNIDVYRLGGSYKLKEPPREEDTILLTLQGYFYQKVEPAGPISNIRATQINSDVGTAVDASLSWKMAHDLTAVFKAGRFFPGDAFPVTNRDPSTILFANLTYSY